MQCDNGPKVGSLTPLKLPMRSIENGKTPWANFPGFLVHFHWGCNARTELVAGVAQIKALLRPGNRDLISRLARCLKVTAGSYRSQALNGDSTIFRRRPQNPALE